MARRGTTHDHRAMPEPTPAASRRLVRLRDGSLPPPEPWPRKLLIRGTALVALAVTAAYLLWRATSTVNLEFWWVAVPMLAVEIHNGLGLLLYTIALWSVDPEPPANPTPSRRWRVAVLIPTYNEPPEVLLPTIAASVALQPEHETWVLDDGRRPEIRALAERLGARYLTRPDNQHAKAGNLNHALRVVEADIVAILDADHVPTARFLTATLPYFDDPKVAFVQTPQDFYNLDSFEHQRRWNGQIFNEEAVFYRVIAPAKNRWSAPFWCGTCALVRVEALRSVGGVATESVTEDIHTTIRMYRAGWSGRYHNEVLARGLAPEDAEAYMVQRNRWALGAMQVLRLENPLFRPGLTVAQRIAFATTLFGWFDSWRALAYVVLPLVVVATGAVPIAAPGEIFGPFFLATLGSQFVALRLLARGHYPPILSILFEVLRMPAVLPATLAVFRPQASRRFSVTPKGRRERTGGRGPVPPLLSVLAAASSLGLAWFTANLLGVGPLRYAVPWAAIGAAFFLAANLGFLLAAIGRIRSARFSGNRRASARIETVVPAVFAGRRGWVVDLSITGARVVLPAAGATGAPDSIPDRDRLRLEIDGPDGEAVELDAEVRRQAARPDGSLEVGLAFAPDQLEAVARLAVAVFHTAVPTEGRPVETVLHWQAGLPGPAGAEARSTGAAGASVSEAA
jgi:cellulose synthase (UDP-forming)